MTDAAVQELLIRIATDRALADEIRDDPTLLSSRFGLSAEQVAMVGTTRIDTRSAKPRQLEERLSRSGGTFGTLVAAAAEATENATADALPDSETEQETVTLLPPQAEATEPEPAAVDPEPEPVDATPAEAEAEPAAPAPTVDPAELQARVHEVLTETLGDDAQLTPEQEAELVRELTGGRDEPPAEPTDPEPTAAEEAEAERPAVASATPTPNLTSGHVVNPDGSWNYFTDDGQGNRVETTVGTDGIGQRIYHHPDGTRTTMWLHQEADGSLTESRTFKGEWSTPVEEVTVPPPEPAPAPPADVQAGPPPEPPPPNPHDVMVGRHETMLHHGYREARVYADGHVEVTEAYHDGRVSEWTYRPDGLVIASYQDGRGPLPHFDHYQGQWQGWEHTVRETHYEDDDGNVVATHDDADYEVTTYMSGRVQKVEVDHGSVKWFFDSISPF